MANQNSQQPTDFDENLSKKRKLINEKMDMANKSYDDEQIQRNDASLEILFRGFKAPRIINDEHELKDLSKFLVKHGSRITKLNYREDSGEKNRQLIIKHCPNISEVSFAFTEYPDQVDDDESQRLVKFLTALAPVLTRLETINNLIGLHYLSCMGFIYENFSSKIKFVKTDELKPEELSVLSGDNCKNNPALSLQELIYCDNDFLYSQKRNNRSPESLALKPASLTDLLKLTNLRRIDLPFLLSKDKIPPVTAPLPLLNYASIRLISNKSGKLATSSFIENLGKALANISELKLDGVDPGLFVLTSTLKSCVKLEKLDLTEYHVWDNYDVGMPTLTAIKPKFKQLYARIHSSYSHEIDVILSLIDNASGLATINIVEIDNKEILDKLIAAGVALSEKVDHNVEVKLTLWRSTLGEDTIQVPSELPSSSKPDNLKIDIHFDN